MTISLSWDANGKRLRRAIGAILLLAIALGLQALADVPASNSSDPAFGEAEKAAQREAGEKVRDDLMAAVARGDKQFTIPPGVYRLAAVPKQRYAIVLNKVLHLVIDGTGAKFWLEDFCGGIQCISCDDVTLKGVSFDYDPIPLVSGTIREVDQAGHSVVIETDPGFGYDRLAAGIAGHHLAPWAMLNVCDPATRRFKLDSVSFGIKACVPIDATHVRVRVDGTQWAGVVPGALAGLRAGGPPVVSLAKCRDMVLDSMAVLAGPGMGFYQQLSETPTHYIHCRVARPANTLRLNSTGADAFHSSMDIQGPIYEECVVEGSGDDAYCLHGFFDFVMKQSAPDHVQIAPLLYRDFNQGGTLSFYTFPDFRPLGTAQVVSFTSSHDPAELTDANQMNLEASKVPGGRVMRMATKEVVDVQLDKPLNLPRLTIVETDAYHSDGGQVLRCTATNVRGRGTILSTTNCLVEGNRYDWITGPGVEIGADIPWMQGPFSRNITVRDNTLTDTFISQTSRLGYKTALGAISVPVYTPRLVHSNPMQDIRIENNRIDGCYSPGIAVQNTQDVVITGNRLSDTNRGDPLELGEALGLDPHFVILLAEDKNFTVENNTMVDPLPSGVGKMGIDQRSTSESLEKHD